MSDIKFTETDLEKAIIEQLIDIGYDYAIETDQWFLARPLDSFINEEDATVTLPQLKISAKLISNPSAEIGSKIEAIDWSATYTDGQYSYGSVEQQEHGAGTKCNLVTHFEDINGKSMAILSKSSIEESTTDYLSDVKQLDLEVKKLGEYSYGDLVTKWAYTEADFTPVNSLGKPQETLRIAAKLSSSEIVNQCKINGYREGCFYGTISWNNFEIDNELIRDLPGKTGKNYEPGQIKYTILPDSTVLFIAVERGKKITSVLNTTVNAEMFGEFNEETQKYGNFEKVEVTIGGADSNGNTIGKYPAEYDVYYYKPEYAYTKKADIVITLGV